MNIERSPKRRVIEARHEEVGIFVLTLGPRHVRAIRLGNRGAGEVQPSTGNAVVPHHEGVSPHLESAIFVYEVQRILLSVEHRVHTHVHQVELHRPHPRIQRCHPEVDFTAHAALFGVDLEMNVQVLQQEATIRAVVGLHTRLGERTPIDEETTKLCFEAKTLVYENVAAHHGSWRGRRALSHLGTTPQTHEV